MHAAFVAAEVAGQELSEDDVGALEAFEAEEGVADDAVGGGFGVGGRDGMGAEVGFAPDGAWFLAGEGQDGDVGGGGRRARRSSVSS